MRQADGDGQPYPLVITDAHMPEVDGFTLAGEIRRKHDADEPVIMMLTSGDRPSDVADCKRLGISAYLLKPIKQSELLEAIELALGLLGQRKPQPGVVDRRLTGQCAGRPEADTPRSLRILLAEDSLVNQQLAVALLTGEGHEVVVVNNGREAVAAVEQDRFDVVLMDVQMPDMDGLEATAIIRRNESAAGGRHLPIIAMTAHALAGDCQRCLDAGMDGYTAKPIDADELFAAIAELTPAASEAADSAIPSDADPVDWSAALQSFRGDRRLLDTIVEAATREIPELLASIRASVTEGDPQALRLAAHTLKGSVRYFGAVRVSDLAARLESTGQAENLHSAREVLPAISDACDQLLASLTRHAARSELQKPPVAPEPVA